MPNSTERHTVSMSCQAPSGQHVELIGDFPDWNHPITMTEVSPGEYQCTVALTPGIYRYKFRLNHRLWFADPRASILDESNPFRNAVLVIGGIEHPFLFAPDRRHLYLNERGHLVVQVEAPLEMETPNDAPLELLVNLPGRHWDSTRFEEIARQRGGRILRATITRPEYADPNSHVNYRFSAVPDVVFELPVLPEIAASLMEEEKTLKKAAYIPGRRYLTTTVTGRKSRDDHSAKKDATSDELSDAEKVEEFVLRAPLFDEPPKWLDRAVFYSVFLDRWLRESQAPTPEGVKGRTFPSGPTTFYGGDLAGIAEHLDHIIDTGANAVLVSSVRPSPDPLRRCATDLLSIDSLVGGDKGLMHLVQCAHEKGVRVVVEAALTHVSLRHPLFARVLRDQERSDYADWFHIHRFPVSPADPTSYDHLPGHPECVALNLSEVEPRRYAMRSFDELIKMGIDGVLLHGLNDAPTEFWRTLRTRLRRLNPNLLIAGQASGDNVASFEGSQGVDAIFDVRHRENLSAFFASETIDGPTFCTRVNYDDVKLGPLNGSFFIQSLDTLDTPRFIGSAHMQDRLRLALTWLFLRPGPLCLTYGTELGAEFLNGSLMLQNAWRDMPPVIQLSEPHAVTQRLLHRLSLIRRDLRPVAKGSYLMEPFGERCVYVLRQFGSQQVFALFNAGRLPIHIPRADIFQTASELCAINILPHTDPMTLPARSARIFALGIPNIPDWFEGQRTRSG